MKMNKIYAKLLLQNETKNKKQIGQVCSCGFGIYGNRLFPLVVLNGCKTYILFNSDFHRHYNRH